MNALRLALVAASVTLIAASDFGAKECQAETYYSVQVDTIYYGGTIPIGGGWETVFTTTDRGDAYELRDFIEYLLKKDLRKLVSIMRNDYGFPRNAFFFNVRVVQWEIWNEGIEAVPIWSIP